MLIQYRTSLFNSILNKQIKKFHQNLIVLFKKNATKASQRRIALRGGSLCKARNKANK